LVKRFRYLYKLPLALIRYIYKKGLRNFFSELKELDDKPATVSTDGLSDQYTALMKKFIRGRGVAFGSGEAHLAFLPNLIVVFVDEPGALEPINDDCYDFIIYDLRFNLSDSCMEAVASGVRVLKPGGIVCFIFREPDDILDRETGKTNLFNKGLRYKTESLISNYLHKTKNEAIITSYFQACGLTARVLAFTIYRINGFKECLYMLEIADNTAKLFKLLEKKLPAKGDNQSIIDVIVPIYNAYEDFVLCLYSLVKHQDIYRIILIDDCSTDARVKELIQNIKKYNSEDFIVVENEQNSGYLKTANKGMSMTENDVILLNSDTIVTSGWARKMRDCAYSDRKIATVTPFTNNGETCSIPVMSENNDIPEGFSIDSFADCVERCSNRKYPELPAAVGFCMLIKRNVINEIGFFDEEIFGKGYGEEDEFSMRAMRKGYKSVLCDDTFIFHKGCASFLDKRDRLKQNNHKALAKMYPDYFPALKRFMENNPLKECHENIKLHISSSNNSSRCEN